MDATKLSPSTGNRQPLKYIVVDEEGTLEEVFGTLEMGVRYLPYFSQSKKHWLHIRMQGHHSDELLMMACDGGLGLCILGAIDGGKLREF